MKKGLIVISIILGAAICNAGVIDELYKKTSTINVTEMQGKDNGIIYGLTLLDRNAFIIQSMDFFASKSDYSIIVKWAKSDDSYCMTFAGNSEVYALCIYKNKVLAKLTK